jgi:hypothetical protein
MWFTETKIIVIGYMKPPIMQVSFYNFPLLKTCLVEIKKREKSKLKYLKELYQTNPKTL